MEKTTMKSKGLKRGIVRLAALIMVLSTFGLASQASAEYACLPSCAVNDARFLAVSGQGLETLAGQDISILFSLSPLEQTLEIGIFDGDAGGLWDVSTFPVTYALYADPDNDGQPDGLPLATWDSSSSSMKDNGWGTLTFPVNESARAPSGNLFYVLQVSPVNSNLIGANRFKVRSSGQVSLRNSPFAFIAAVNNWDAVPIVFPNYPAATPTTYDGTFDFHPYVMSSQPDFTVWDGDVDFGRYDCSVNDTDDPDTPNDAVPPWAVGTVAVPEGVAVGTSPCRNESGAVIVGPEGQTRVTGAPADDSSNAYSRRPWDVTYRVTDPKGNFFDNLNPSGNREWEQFRIAATEASGLADHYVMDQNRMPSGLYHIRMTGVDINNLNAWRFPTQVIGVCAEGDPCKPVLHAYLIGDTVFSDFNENGQQDFFEPGIQGVVVYLLDGFGEPVLDVFNQPIKAWTDGSGKYLFEVDGLTVDPYTGEVLNSGTYKVKIGAENFVPGGRLFGQRPTVDYSGDGVGDNDRTQTVVDRNLLDFDFGYVSLSTTTVKIGDTVWYDTNQNGLQESGELGIAGVIINLYDSNGDFLASTTTNSSGIYQFTVLAYREYTVAVAAENFLMGGLLYGTFPTVDYTGDNVGDNSRTQLVLNSNVLTYDFGYFKEPRGGEGCTPGYWKQKQHFDSWVLYQPTDYFDLVFGVGPRVTLLQALGTNGGGEQALRRHAAAALLNAAAFPEVDYYYHVAEVIQIVRTAYATKNYETAKNWLEKQNEKGCPLN